MALNYLWFDTMAENYPRYLNLVFQGGGVRGIAYAGVLEKMPDYLIPRAVGGTSAGAIVAGLLAIGKRGPDLKQYLSPKIFAGFLAPEEKARVQRLAAAVEEARAIWMEASRKGKGISSWEAFWFSRLDRGPGRGF
jgi:predicted acylesterase/phospholipase RssA